MSSDRRKEAVEILETGKLGSLVVGGLSVAASVYFPYHGVWVVSGMLCYGAYEFYTVAQNMQGLYKSKVSEIKARLSRNEAIDIITRHTYVAKSLFNLFSPQDFGNHLFPD